MTGIPSAAELLGVTLRFLAIILPACVAIYASVELVRTWRIARHMRRMRDVSMTTSSLILAAAQSGEITARQGMALMHMLDRLINDRGADPQTLLAAMVSAIGRAKEIETKLDAAIAAPGKDAIGGEHVN